MREIRTSSSEGGGAKSIVSPYPYHQLKSSGSGLAGRDGRGPVNRTSPWFDVGYRWNVASGDRDSSIRRRWQLCLAVRGAALPPCLPILPHPFGRGVASLRRHRRPFPLRHSLASLFRAC